VNAQLMARSAYAGAAIPTRTDRGVEYDAFAKCTHALTLAQAGKGGYPAMVQALHDNRLLWTALAADVSKEENGLPVLLRARIFYLAEFTLHHSRRVLAGDSDAAALIDVNTAIMRGLRGSELTS
jgi:flagellar biosynthesis activator protein FlaF